jgi:hypothetical protein
MSDTVETVINDVRVEGFPTEDASAIFLLDGIWRSGWPLDDLDAEVDDDGLFLWEANGGFGKFYGVRYWMLAPNIDERA